MRQADHEVGAVIYRNMLRHYKIGEHDGWKGIFTTDQSPLARIANGARVEKIAGYAGDQHPIGSRGTVLGSVGARNVGVAYFIEFDATTREATLIVEGKLAAIAAERDESYRPSARS